MKVNSINSAISASEQLCLPVCLTKTLICSHHISALVHLLFIDFGYFSQSLHLWEPHSCLGDAVDVRNSLCLLHLVFQCHRIEGYRLLSGHKRLYWCVYLCVCVCVSMVGVICLLVGITFNRCPANWNRPDVLAASFLACFFFFHLFFFPKRVCCVCVCVCVCVQGGLLKTWRQLLGLDVNTGWYRHTHI